MSVYKEIGFVAGKVESESRRIYSDACDYGVPIKTINDPLIKEVKGVIDLYHLKVRTERYSTGFTQKINFNGGAGAVIEAGFEKATFTFVSTKGDKNMIGYLCVSTETSLNARQEAIAADY